MLKFAISALSFVITTAAFADAYITVQMNRGEVALEECGGTVEVKSSGQQTNLILRNVDQCSNLSIPGGQDYKIPGDNVRSGSFTLPAWIMTSGMNRFTATVQSNSGKHRDDVTILIYKAPTPIPQPLTVKCLRNARIAAEQKFINDGGLAFMSAGNFNRVSGKGNLVFNVDVAGFWLTQRYEVVTANDSTCELKGIQSID